LGSPTAQDVGFDPRRLTVPLAYNRRNGALDPAISGLPASTSRKVFSASLGKSLQP